MKAGLTNYKLSCGCWVIYAQFKNRAVAPVRVAYKRACDAAREAQDMARGTAWCGYDRSKIKSFIVCRRDDKEIVRFDKVEKEGAE